MSTNHVNVRKNFKDERTDSRINGVLVPGNQIIHSPNVGQFVINDNQPLEIKLVDKDNEAFFRDPCSPFIIGDKAFKFYINLESHKAFNFNVNMNENGYTISQRSCLLSSKTVLISRLTKQLNIWPIRLLLLPIELAWKVLQFIVGIARFFFVSIFALKEAAGNTNITVGSDEGYVPKP
ncbi:MAG: hypothetical protein QG657_1198 [Acidobacteriota bacterium]|nr:hypothetical protein [Acidobacteriota bacterium]